MNIKLTEKQAARLLQRYSEIPLSSRPSGDYDHNAQRLLSLALDEMLEAPACVFGNIASKVGGGVRAEITPWQAYENKIRQDQMRELHPRLALADAVEAFVGSLKKGVR